jgi:CheY-like chemotaxis protein
VRGIEAGRAGTVLVVDDNHEITNVVSELLAISGHEVAAAHGGRSGIEVASRLKPDVILMDIDMPDLDGYTAVRRLGEIPGLKDIPVVFLTAVDQDQFAPELSGRDRRASLHLKKPFSSDQLSSVIRRAIDSALGSSGR